MTRDEVVQRVIDIVVEELRIPGELVGPESTFEELGADSLAKAEIAFEVEDEFDLVMTSEGPDCRSLPELVEVVVNKMGDRVGS